MTGTRGWFVIMVAAALTISGGTRDGSAKTVSASGPDSASSGRQARVETFLNRLADSMPALAGVFSDSMEDGYHTRDTTKAAKALREGVSTLLGYAEPFSAG